MKINDRLKTLLEGACVSALFQGRALDINVAIEKPRLKEHGDFASGIALTIADGNTKTAMLIAQAIVDNLKAVPKDVATIGCENGFINFNLGPYFLCQSLRDLHAASKNLLPKAKTGQIDRATMASKKDSLFYIQYMHAKLSACLSVALERAINTEAYRVDEPLIQPAEWQNLLASYGEEFALFRPLFHSEANIFSRQKDLVLHLDSHQIEISLIANDKNNECITDYACKLASKLDNYFEHCLLSGNGDVVTNSSLSKAEWAKSYLAAHLGLIVAAKRVLAHCLGILGLVAPTTI